MIQCNAFQQNAFQNTCGVPVGPEIDRDAGDYFYEPNPYLLTPTQVATAVSIVSTLLVGLPVLIPLALVSRTDLYPPVFPTPPLPPEPVARPVRRRKKMVMTHSTIPLPVAPSPPNTYASTISIALTRAVARATGSTSGQARGLIVGRFFTRPRGETQAIVRRGIFKRFHPVGDTVGDDQSLEELLRYDLLDEEEVDA